MKLNEPIQDGNCAENISLIIWIVGQHARLR